MPDRVFSPYYITFFMPDRVFSPIIFLPLGLLFIVTSSMPDRVFSPYYIVLIGFIFSFFFYSFFVSLLVFPFFLVLLGTFGTLFELMRTSNGFFAVRCHKSI